MIARGTTNITSRVFLHHAERKKVFSPGDGSSTVRARRPTPARQGAGREASMEELPYDTLVSLLSRLPRASLFNVAQVSRALLLATEDARLWDAGREATGVPTGARGLFAPGGLRGTSSPPSVGREDGCIRATVARWVASLLRVPWQSLVPLVRFEHGTTSGARFHVKISLHPIRAVLGRSEALAAADADTVAGGGDEPPRGRHRSPWNAGGSVGDRFTQPGERGGDGEACVRPRHPLDPGDGGGGGVRDRQPEDAWLLSVGSASPAASLATAAAAAMRAQSAVDDMESAANRLAALLEAEVRRVRADPDDGEQCMGKQSAKYLVTGTTRRRRWHTVAAAVQSVRPERGSIRLRLAPRFLVAAALLPVHRVAPPASVPRSCDDALNASRGDSSTLSLSTLSLSSAEVVLRAPQPPTPWSLLRARLVGTALQTLCATNVMVSSASKTRQRANAGRGAGRESEREGGREGGRESGERAAGGAVPRQPPPDTRASGPAVRAVMEAARFGADGGNGNGNGNGGGVAVAVAVGVGVGVPAAADAIWGPGSGVGSAGAGDASDNGGGGFASSVVVTDARAGNAWPALVKEPGGGGGGGGSGDWHGGGGRLRGVVVGGCKCMDSVADAVDAAAFCDDDDGGGDDDADGGCGSDDPRLRGAAAVALALLSYAPRAHECVLEPPHRWRRHLSNAVAALALLRSLSGRPQPEDECEVEEEEENAAGLAGVDLTDGELAIWLEECGTKLQEARVGEERDPREAAAGVLGLAAAAAAVARRHPPDQHHHARAGAPDAGFRSGVPSRSAGSIHSGAAEAAVDEQAVERVRRRLMRRTLDALARSLAFIGVLETPGQRATDDTSGSGYGL